MTQDQIQELER